MWSGDNEVPGASRGAGSGLQRCRWLRARLCSLHTKPAGELGLGLAEGRPVGSGVGVGVDEVGLGVVDHFPRYVKPLRHVW